MQKSNLKTETAAKSNPIKLDNHSFGALRFIKILRVKHLGWDLIDFTSVLDHYNWGFTGSEIRADFQHLGLSVSEIASKGKISKYQIFCLVKLSSIINDAKVLYENNLIDFSELRSIILRVRNDSYKRFLLIQKAHAKNELQNSKLDSDSLILLQAKLAILENED